MSKSLEKEKIFEAAEAEMRELHDLESKVDAKPFINPPLDFVLTEFPKRFGMYPVLMEEYQTICKKRGIDSIEKKFHRDIHPDFNVDIYNIISEYFRPQIEQKSLNIMRMLVQPSDIEHLRYLKREFLQRPDLEKPFPEWQHARTFDIQIGEKPYQCTVVADPGGREVVSFMLRSELSEKGSIKITFKPFQDRFKNYRKQYTQNDFIFMEIFESAEQTVKNFYELRERIRAIRSRQKYPNIDVPALALKIITGETITPKDTDHPIEALGLFYELPQIEALNSGLNALDYAAMAVDSKEQLKDIMENPQTLTLYVVQGMMKLFKLVMAVGSGHADPSEKMPPDDDRNTSAKEGKLMNMPHQVHTAIENALEE